MSEPIRRPSEIQLSDLTVSGWIVAIITGAILVVGLVWLTQVAWIEEIKTMRVRSFMTVMPPVLAASLFYGLAAVALRKFGFPITRKRDQARTLGN
jgi:hypothetical protein